MFVGHTSRGHTGGRSHRISHPPSFCGVCLNFSRENDSAIFFPRRPTNRSPLVRHFFFFFFFLVVVVVVCILHINRSGLNHTSNIRGCQSGTWSQRGTKVNGSHHGDNPLLRPTGIQIATKSYATLQAMAPTNNKTVHQTSFTPYREQPRSTRIVVAYPRPAFSATNRTKFCHTSYKNKEN